MTPLALRNRREGTSVIDDNNRVRLIIDTKDDLYFTSYQLYTIVAYHIVSYLKIFT